MNHIHQNIHGYFDFEHVYRQYAEQIPAGGTFVEIGVFCGKSIAHFAVECVNRENNVKIYGVDTWTGMAYDERESQNLNNYIRDLPDGLYNHFLDNIKSLPEGVITPIQKLSYEAAEDFEDESVNIIFLDADHTYEGVLKDLQAWYPKLKKGGIFSGHDYTSYPPDDGVFRAVNQFFENKDIKTHSNNVWEIIK